MSAVSSPVVDPVREFEDARAEYEHRLAVADAADDALDVALTRLIAAAISAVAATRSSALPIKEGHPST